MDVGTILQFTLDVLNLGSLYALMALGLVVIYGILKLVNFAYGELVMVAGYTLYLLNGSPLPWLIMALVAVCMAVIGGITTDLVAFRPVRANSLTAMLITSFAFSTLLQNAALLFISPRARNVPLPEIFTQSVTMLGVIIPVRNLITIASAFILLGAFTLVMKRTVLGMALRPPPPISRWRGWLVSRPISSLPSPLPSVDCSPASWRCSGLAGSARWFRESAWNRCWSPLSPASSAACAVWWAPLSAAICWHLSMSVLITPCPRIFSVFVMPSPLPWSSLSCC